MNLSRVIGYFLVAVILTAAVYIATLSELPLPGRVIAGIDYLHRPWTYFLSGSLASFGLTIAFLVVDEKKYRNISTTLFIISFVLFWIGTMMGL